MLSFSDDLVTYLLMTPTNSLRNFIFDFNDIYQTESLFFLEAALYSFLNTVGLAIVGLATSRQNQTYCKSLLHVRPLEVI